MNCDSNMQGIRRDCFTIKRQFRRIWITVCTYITLYYIMCKPLVLVHFSGHSLQASVQREALSRVERTWRCMAIILMLVPVHRWSCQTVRLRLAARLCSASVTVPSVSLRQRHSFMKLTRCWWASTVHFLRWSVPGSGLSRIRWSSLWYLRRVSLGTEIICAYTETRRDSLKCTHAVMHMVMQWHMLVCRHVSKHLYSTFGAC